jgi:hypothetical protein
MLTTAQQKVKQELEELQINALAHHKKVIVIPSKKPALKRWFFTIIIVLLLIAACSLLLQGYWTQKQSQGIISYLTKVDNYNEQSEKIVNDYLTGDIGNLEKGIAMQADLLSKVSDLETSTSFYSYQHDLMALLQGRLDMMTNYEDPQHSDNLQLNKVLIELSVKQALAADSLTKGFEREKIKYLVRDDSTVQFWINAKSYQVKK